MKIIPPLAKFSRKEWFLIVSGILDFFLLLQYHLILEFSVIMNNGLPFFFIIFHLIALSFGAIFALKVVNIKWNHLTNYIFFNSLMVFFFICLLVINQPWFVPIGLFGAGFSIGVLYGILYEQFFPVFENPKFGARFFSLGMIGITLLIVIEGIINIILNPWLGVVYIFLTYFLIIFFALMGKDALNKFVIQEPLNIQAYFKNKDNIPKICLAFFLGFFWTNTYYVAVLFLEMNRLEMSLNTFVIVMCITIAIFSFPCGLLSDIIGRRITILIGLISQALAFLILSFFSQNEIILLFIFPIFLGIGISMSLSIGMVVLGEFPERKYLRDNNSFFFVFGGMGMTCGIILGELLKPLFFAEPAYLTVILLFIFVCATMVIFQIKETLPSKAKIYIKPETLTEEEIALYRERKICLVCKGKVARILYLCPQCDTLYCTKCAKALSDLENMCWVCNAPFDEFKPVKPYKREDEFVGKVAHKKGKKEEK